MYLVLFFCFKSCKSPIQKQSKSYTVAEKLIDLLSLQIQIELFKVCSPFYTLKDVVDNKNVRGYN